MASLELYFVDEDGTEAREEDRGVSSLSTCEDMFPWPGLQLASPCPRLLLHITGLEAEVRRQMT